MIAGMLIAKNTDAAAAAEQLDDGLESFCALEKNQAPATARPPHVCVDKAIAELLINSGGFHVVEKARHELSKQLPISEVTQHQYDRNARAEVSMHCIEIFRRDPLQDRFQWSGSDFCGVKEVRAELLKMPSHESA